MHDGDECPSTLADGDKKIHRHFVKSPVAKLSPNMWAQVKLKGRKRVWSKFSGDERKDEYVTTGTVRLEISTSEGSVIEDLFVSLSHNDIPF